MPLNELLPNWVVSHCMGRDDWRTTVHFRRSDRATLGSDGIWISVKMRETPARSELLTSLSSQFSLGPIEMAGLGVT
jgi:hypothetical protein